MDVIKIYNYKTNEMGLMAMGFILVLLLGL